MSRPCDFASSIKKCRPPIKGGVPFGVAAAAPVTFTTAAPRNKNRHMCWYGTSGAGKGYSLRVLLSRERFANGLRV